MPNRQRSIVYLNLHAHLQLFDSPEAFQLPWGMTTNLALTEHKILQYEIKYAWKDSILMAPRKAR